MTSIKTFPFGFGFKKYHYLPKKRRCCCKSKFFFFKAPTAYTKQMFFLNENFPSLKLDEIAVNKKNRFKVQAHYSQALSDEDYFELKYIYIHRNLYSLKYFCLIGIKYEISGNY